MAGDSTTRRNGGSGRPNAASGEARKQSARASRGKPARSGKPPLSNVAHAASALRAAADVPKVVLVTGVARYLVETIRINPRGAFGLSNAQAASVASVLAGLLLLVVLQSKSRLPAPRESRAK